jgi:hypothetical protein
MLACLSYVISGQEDALEDSNSTAALPAHEDIRLAVPVHNVVGSRHADVSAFGGEGGAMTGPAAIADSVVDGPRSLEAASTRSAFSASASHISQLVLQGL